MFLSLNCKKFVCFLFSIIIVPFLKFSNDFGLIFVDMNFYIRNGDNFVNGVSSINSNIINFGKRGSCCIFFIKVVRLYARSLEIFLLFAWVIFSRAIKKVYKFHWLCSPPTTEPHKGRCLGETHLPSNIRTT